MATAHTFRNWLGRCAAIAVALAMSVGAAAQVGPPPEGPMDGSEDYYNIAADARRIAAALAELDIAPPEGELLDVTAELDAVDIKPRDTVPNYDVDVLGPNRIYASRLSKGCGIAIVGMIEFSGLKEKRQGGYLSIVWNDGGVTHLAFGDADAEGHIKQIQVSRLSSC
jgi:hypothetical protein